MKIPLLFSFILSMMVSGCASTERSIALGAAAGAVGGAVNGALLFPVNKKKSVLRGALIGGVAGAALGLVTHKYLKKRDQRTRKDTLLNLQRHDVLNPHVGVKNNNPGLTKPIVEMDWVEPKIQKGRYIEGHKVWKISESSQWVFPNEIERAKEKENEK